MSQLEVCFAAPLDVEGWAEHEAVDVDGWDDVAWGAEEEGDGERVKLVVV